MILRDYQERAIAAVREHYRSARKRIATVIEVDAWSNVIMRALSSREREGCYGLS